MTGWLYNDPEISDHENLYRRIKKIPQCRTFDPVANAWKPSPGGLRREAGEGLSVHLHSVLIKRGRNVMTLYPSADYGSICFHAAVPRRVGAGVRKTAAENEPDSDLDAAHADVLPRRPEKDRVHWKTVVNEIVAASSWVQPATCDPTGELRQISAT